MATPIAMVAALGLLAACGGSSSSQAAATAPTPASDTAPTTAEHITAATTTKTGPKPTHPPATAAATTASTEAPTTVPSGCPSFEEISAIIGLPNVSSGGFNLLARGHGGTCNYTWPDKNGKPNGYDAIGVAAKFPGTVADVGIGVSGCPPLKDTPNACGGFAGTSPDLEQANFHELVDGRVILVRVLAATDFHFGAKLFDWAKQVAALIRPRF